MTTGTVIDAVPVKESAPNVSPMPRIAPPETGSVSRGAVTSGAAGVNPAPTVGEKVSAQGRATSLYVLGMETMRR